MEREPIARLLGHPLHPLLVHFPIALWGMSFVFDLLSLKLGPAMVEAARYNVLGGIIAAVVAGLTGVLDYFTHLRPGSPARRIGRYHAALNGLALGLFSASLILRWQLKGAPVTPRLPIVLSAVGVAVLGISGYLGGVMVYNHGVGVDLTRARHPIEPHAAERQRAIESPVESREP